MFYNRQTKQRFKLPEGADWERTDGGRKKGEPLAPRCRQPSVQPPGLPAPRGSCCFGVLDAAGRDGRADPRDWGCGATAPAAGPVTHHRLIAGFRKLLK